jgi:glyoxylase-like metal-dependent hydrolase (beta-lactamase superfamily II)
VDLGDRSFEVLHVPGHTAGSIALWDGAGGMLFTGDTAALDDPLYAEDERAFVASLERLRELPVELVCAGHSRPFGRDELRSLIDEQLEKRG